MAEDIRRLSQAKGGGGFSRGAAPGLAGDASVKNFKIRM